MRPVIFRSLIVCSILITIVIIGCKDEQKTAIVEEYVSISGLLTPQDTLMDYGDLGKKKLSDYGFFREPLNQLIPASKQVVPYTLNSPLFTDYAYKKRFIVFPEGRVARYQSDEAVLDFPEGTTIIKNFYYSSEDLKSSDADVILETRLLILKNEEWITLPYVWNEEQTEAYLYILGKDIDLVLEANNERDEAIHFSYSVPNINMCKNCHIKNQELVPLGPTPRQMNRNNNFANNSLIETRTIDDNQEAYTKENQLTYLQDNQFLTGLPDISEVDEMPDYSDASKSLDSRARAYLDVNCAHCHQDGGSAKTSGLHLVYEETDMYRLGVNKPPVAAGKGSGNLAYDIVKGKPEESIILYRMKHLEPDIVMPEIGKNLIHDEGVALIAEWIREL